MVVFVGGVWLLAIPFSPKAILETGTVIDKYRAMGMVPEANGTTVSKEIGHDVFELPKDDKKYLMEEMAAMGMKMETKEDGHGKEEKEEKGHDEKPEKMAEMKGGMKEEKEEHGKEEAEEGGHGGGSEAEGLKVLALGTAAEVERELAEQSVKADTVMNIDMKEWGFSNGMLMAQPGQVIRMKVKNTGAIPHEFMLMNAPGMNAVSYRLVRSDWNLLEHEALTEVPFVMPGDSFEMVVKVYKSGAWMYMCMFPYHMQLGMMGMLMTPDMMGKMGPMKM